MTHARSMMMGAPEVVSLNAALIKMSRAKKVLDIGVFTGASSLSAALALPEGDWLKNLLLCNFGLNFLYSQNS